MLTKEGVGIEMSVFQWIIDSLEPFCQSGCKIARAEWTKEEIVEINRHGYEVRGTASEGWLIVKKG